MKSLGIALVCALALLGPLPVSAACINPPMNSTSWWLGDGTGDDAIASLDATSMNGATFGTGYIRSGAFQFDGNDDYASVADDPALDPGTGDLTVNFWVNLTADGGEMVMVEKFDENVGTGWTLARRFGSVYFATSGVDIQTSTPIDVGVWTHIAMRRSSGTVTLFKDGAPIDSATAVFNFDNSHELLFGRRRGGQGFFWNGRIDEIQLHIGTGLSDAEILAIYNAGSDGQCTTCLNGLPDPGEACDDGNTTNGDGCDNNCTVTACGNGIATSGETCDDGNVIDDDGCDSNCTLTSCGNGIVSLGETCDDGNAIDDDGCDSNCTVTACGNEIITSGEVCDDGNLVSGDDCDSNCTPTACGNGIVSAGEACDDGNLIDGDGCDSNCGCGNGVVAGSETCDDANAMEGDGCDTNCTITACGNGIATAGEGCDDGNGVSGDGCEADCTTTPVMENAAAGDTVTTDPSGSGPSPEIPAQAAITTPNPGEVLITSSDEPLELRLSQLVGVQLRLEAPDADPATPLIVVLTLEGSLFPPGVDPSRLGIVRDGVVVRNCSGAPGVASPDPCLQSIVVLPSSDVQFTGLTSHMSLWGAVLRALSRDEQKCISGMNRAGLKVAKAQAKLNAECLKNAADGTELDAQACLGVDASGKVGDAQTRAENLDAVKCVPAPPFGYTGASALNAGAQAESLALIGDIFGADLTASVISSSNRPGATCQAKVLKAAQGLFAFESNRFLKCKKTGLTGRTGLIATGEQLQGCFGVLAADPGGRIARAAAAVRDALDDCEVDLGTTFPGECTAGDVAACMVDRVECRVCRMLNAMDGLTEDCDRFDDGATNGSCG